MTLLKILIYLAVIGIAVSFFGRLMYNNSLAAGTKAYHESHWEIAERYFERAVFWGPRSATAYIWLAESERPQKKFDQALAHYERAIKLGADTLETRTLIGFTYLDMQEYVTARSEFQHALLLNSKYPLANQGEAIAVYYMARPWSKSKVNLEEAIPFAERAVEQDPTNPSMLATLAGIYTEIGRYQDAIPVAQKAITLRPDYCGSYVNIADAFIKAGRYPEASYNIEKAIELTQSDPKQDCLVIGSIMRGKLYEAQGRDQDALAEYQAALTKPIRFSIHDGFRQLAQFRIDGLKPNEAR